MKSNRTFITLTGGLAIILLCWMYLIRKPNTSGQETILSKKNNTIANQNNLWSNDPEVLYLSADTLVDLNQLDSALILLIHAENILVDAGEATGEACAKNLYLKAYTLQAKRDFDAAIVAYEKSITIRRELADPPKHNIAKAYTNIGTCLFSKQQYEPALANHKIASDIWSDMVPEAEAFLVISLSNQSSCLGMMGDYSAAIVQLEKVIDLNSEKFISSPLSVATTYDNLGIWMRNTGNWKSAINQHENALNILMQLDSSYVLISKMANVYNNLAMCYELRGDEEKTLAYYEKALRLRQNNLENREPLNVAISLENVGMHFCEQGVYEPGIALVKQALEIRRTNLSGDTIASFQHLCHCLHKKKDYGKAREYCELALNYSLQNEDANPDKVASSYASLAEIFYELDQVDRAIRNYEEAYHLWNNIHGNKHYHLAITANGLGKCFQKNNDLTKALEWYEKALVSNDYSNRSFENVLSIPTLIETFQNIANTHQQTYQKKNRLASLRQAYGYHKKAEASILFQRFNISQSSSKNTLNAISHQAQERGLHTAYKLYQKTDSVGYLQNMFVSSEAAKSRTLCEALHEAEALQFAGIPDDLLEKEKKLRADITHLQEKIFHLDQQEKENISIADKLHDQLFQQKKSWEQLVLTFQKKYPDYYKLKFNLNTTSVKEVQQKILSPQQSLLQYFVGDATIYIFLVQQNNYEVHQVERDFPLEQWIKNLTKEGIYAYYGTTLSKRNSSLIQRSIANYTTAAQQLYDKLLAPVKDRLTEQLIIIPDEMLGYVPFEVLLKAKPARAEAFASFPFLIYDHQISYCYSATLLRDMLEKQHRKKTKQTLLAIAPFSQKDVTALIACHDTTLLVTLRDSIVPLPATGEEVASIGHLLKGDTWYGQEASIARFNKFASDYRILHLSTHGKADDRVGDYAYLAFGTPTASDNFEKLYARDLYNYALNADMVVLSACETGIGKLQKGEGIISLARAFAYAGAKSIFTTLWQVNDIKTKDLMISFYKNLKEGQTKDAALRNAKLEYLRKNDGQEMHPFFWAGMIGIGDMRAITDY